MEMSGQLHVLATLPPAPIGKENKVGPRASLVAVVRRKNFSPCWEFNPGHTAHSTVTT